MAKLSKALAKKADAAKEDWVDSRSCPRGCTCAA
jgi:hypothetical protein